MKKLLSLILTLAMLCTMCVAFGITASAEAPSGNFVTFSSPDSFTITAQKKWDGTLYYSTSGEEASWTEYAGGTALTAAQIGGTGDYYLCFRGENNSTMSNGMQSSAWSIIGSNVACNGSIEDLRDYTGERQMNSFCFYKMFSGCTALTTAPSLPATTLITYCYANMFSGCTALTEAPALPATNLDNSCYLGMFSGCTSLVEAPVLPATTLADYCYENMFSSCKALAKAPSLPATTLTVSCYRRMFSDCTSLVEAPVLPATNLADSCYQSMFYCSTSLVKAPVLPATTLADYCYESMFEGCEALAMVPSLPATTLADYCYESMFSWCTKIEFYENASDVGGAPLAWIIPAEANVDGLTDWNTDMFFVTGGDFQGTPEIGKTYYYPNPVFNPKSHNVTGSYQAGATAETVYSVEIAWGSMEFAYTDAREGTWNPTTLQYEGASAAGWTCEADANKITIKNHSNTEVNAGLSFTGSVDGISGSFYDATTGGTAIEGSSLALASAAPVGEATTGTEQTGTAYIQIISGVLTSGQTNVKIGTVTVEVN